MDEKSDTSKAEALISLPFFVLGVFGSWKFAEAMNVLAAKYGWNASAGAPNVDLMQLRGWVELGGILFWMFLWAGSMGIGHLIVGKSKREEESDENNPKAYTLGWFLISVLVMIVALFL